MLTKWSLGVYVHVNGVSFDGTASHSGCIPALLQFRHDPEQDKAVTENERLHFTTHTHRVAT